jgi:hypothetical protein
MFIITQGCQILSFLRSEHIEQLNAEIRRLKKQLKEAQNATFLQDITQLQESLDESRTAVQMLLDKRTEDIEELTNSNEMQLDKYSQLLKKISDSDQIYWEDRLQQQEANCTREKNNLVKKHALHISSMKCDFDREISALAQANAKNEAQIQRLKSRYSEEIKRLNIQVSNLLNRRKEDSLAAFQTHEHLAGLFDDLTKLYKAKVEILKRKIVQLQTVGPPENNSTQIIPTVFDGDSENEDQPSEHEYQSFENGKRRISAVTLCTPPDPPAHPTHSLKSTSSLQTFGEFQATASAGPSSSRSK